MDTDESFDAAEAEAKAMIARAQAAVVEGQKLLEDIAAARRVRARQARLATILSGANGSASPDFRAVIITEEKLTAPRERVRKLPTGARQAILRYLESTASAWVLATQIQKGISEILGREVPMSSVSPKLWELKKDGIIVRDEMKVALASRVTEKAKGDVTTDIFE